MEPVVKPDEEGWITLPVSRLVFPPWCCDCGAPTLSRQPFRVHHQTGFALILVPVCETCQGTFRIGYRSAFWKPFLGIVFVMAVAGFIMGSVPAMTGRDPKSFPILPILGFFAAALISSPFVWFAIRRRALRKSPPPVQFRRYVRNQYVTFRFRRPEYTTELLQFLKSTPEAIHQQPPI